MNAKEIKLEDLDLNLSQPLEVDARISAPASPVSVGSADLGASPPSSPLASGPTKQESQQTPFTWHTQQTQPQEDDSDLDLEETDFGVDIEVEKALRSENLLSSTFSPTIVSVPSRTFVPSPELIDVDEETDFNLSEPTPTNQNFDFLKVKLEPMDEDYYFMDTSFEAAPSAPLPPPTAATATETEHALPSFVSSSLRRPISLSDVSEDLGARDDSLDGFDELQFQTPFSLPPPTVKEEPKEAVVPEQTQIASAATTSDSTTVNNAPPPPPTVAEKQPEAVATTPTPIITLETMESAAAPAGQSAVAVVIPEEQVTLVLTETPAPEPAPVHPLLTMFPHEQVVLAHSVLFQLSNHPLFPAIVHACGIPLPPHEVHPMAETAISFLNAILSRDSVIPPVDVDCVRRVVTTCSDQENLELLGQGQVHPDIPKSTFDLYQDQKSRTNPPALHEMPLEPTDIEQTGAPSLPTPLPPATVEVASCEHEVLLHSSEIATVFRQPSEALPRFMRPSLLDQFMSDFLSAAGSTPSAPSVSDLSTPIAISDAPALPALPEELALRDARADHARKDSALFTALASRHVARQSDSLCLPCALAHQLYLSPTPAHSSAIKNAILRRASNQDRVPVNGDTLPFDQTAQIACEALRVELTLCSADEGGRFSVRSFGSDIASPRAHVFLARDSANGFLSLFPHVLPPIRRFESLETRMSTLFGSLKKGLPKTVPNPVLKAPPPPAGRSSSHVPSLSETERLALAQHRVEGILKDSGLARGVLPERSLLWFVLSQQLYFSTKYTRELELHALRRMWSRVDRYRTLARRSEPDFLEFLDRLQGGGLHGDGGGGGGSDKDKVRPDHVVLQALCDELGFSATVLQVSGDMKPNIRQAQVSFFDFAPSEASGGGNGQSTPSAALSQSPAAPAGGELSTRPHVYLAEFMPGHFLSLFPQDLSWFEAVTSSTLTAATVQREVKFVKEQIRKLTAPPPPPPQPSTATAADEEPSEESEGTISKEAAEFLSVFKGAWDRRLAHLAACAAAVPEYRIGVIGDTGAGKSSLINAFLGHDVLPTSSTQACTSVAIELCYHDRDTFAAHVDFMDEQEWSAHLKLCVQDAGLGHFIGIGSHSSRDDESQNEKAARQKAQDVLQAVYGSLDRQTIRDACAGRHPAVVTRALRQKRKSVEHTDLDEFRARLDPIVTNFDPEMTGAIDVTEEGEDEEATPTPPTTGSKRKRTTASNGFSESSSSVPPVSPSKRRAGLLSSQESEGGSSSGGGTADEDGQVQLWPLVKRVQIFGKFASLRGGIKLVDLPGLADVNVAREEVTRRYMRECSYLWIVASQARAASNATVAKVLESDDFKQRLVMEGTICNVAFVVTKSDDFSPVEEGKKHKLYKDQKTLLFKTRNMESRLKIRSNLIKNFVREGASSSGSRAGTAAAVVRFLEQVPIFVVSARGFRDISETAGAGITHFNDTEIGSLRLLVQTLVLQRCAYVRQVRQGMLDFLESVKAICSTIRQAEAPSHAVKHESQRMTPATHGALVRQYNEKRDQLHNTLNALGEKEEKSLLKTVDQNLDEPLKACADASVKTAKDVLSPILSIKNWSTLKAICTRNGGPFMSSNGVTYDVNDSLASAVMNVIEQPWTRFFESDIRHALQAFDAECLAQLARFQSCVSDVLASLRVPKDFAAQVNAEAKKHLCAKSLSGVIGSADSATYEARIEELLAADRRGVRDAVLDVFRRKTRPTFEEISRDGGTGVKARSENRLRSFLLDNSRAMFLSARATVVSTLRELLSKLHEIRKTEMGLVVAHVDTLYLRYLAANNGGGGVGVTSTEGESTSEEHATGAMGLVECVVEQLVQCWSASEDSEGQEEPTMFEGIPLVVCPNCCERSAEVEITPCKHMMCHMCARRMKNLSQQCPTCRTTVLDFSLEAESPS